MWQRFCVIISAFFLCSCTASIPIKPVQYNGDLEIYPAVMKVLANRNAKIEKIDVFNEEFCSDYIYDKDLLVDIRFKLVVKRKNNSIDIALSDMQHMNAKYKTWHDSDVTLVFNKNKYVNTTAVRLTIQ